MSLKCRDVNIKYLVNIRMAQNLQNGVVRRNIDRNGVEASPLQVHCAGVYRRPASRILDAHARACERETNISIMFGSSRRNAMVRASFQFVCQQLDVASSGPDLPGRSENSLYILKARSWLADRTNPRSCQRRGPKKRRLASIGPARAIYPRCSYFVRFGGILEDRRFVVIVNWLKYRIHTGERHYRFTGCESPFYRWTNIND